MRSLLLPACAAAAVLAAASSASSAADTNRQVNFGIGAHWNAGWDSSKSQHVAEKPAAPHNAGIATAAAPQAQDVFASASMGLGGLPRIELPYEPCRDRAQAAMFDGVESVEELIANRKGEHVVLSHREFPELGVRIKQIARASADSASAAGRLNADPEAFCDPTVTSWSGYIDTIDGKSLFFYFFESRSSPKHDPMVLWTNGGPGCSSSLGLFQEHGPCRIPERGGKVQQGPPINGTEWFPQSWNNRANVIYIDQPVGVGFSYSRYGVHTFNTEDAAKDIYRFLRVFFSAFDKFRGNDFHMSGESYGGRYIPVFASEVADRNAQIQRAAAKAGKKPARDELINLKSVLVGNGLTDTSKQMSGYYDMTCTRRGGVEPILSIEECKRMKPWVARCDQWLHDACTATYTAELCQSALDTCSDKLTGPYSATGQNPYNILDDCKAGLDPNLCYNVMEDIRNYLNRDDVRALIGAAPVAEIGKFQTCSNEVANGFIFNNDAAQDNGLNVAGLLERGIKALIYVGDLDWICNWVGNKRWVTALDWSGAHSWLGAKNYQWIVNGKEAGETQAAEGLTWATVAGAGHMVPFDQPDRALAMFNRWIDGEKL